MAKDVDAIAVERLGHQAAAPRAPARDRRGHPAGAVRRPGRRAGGGSTRATSAPTTQAGGKAGGEWMREHLPDGGNLGADPLRRRPPGHHRARTTASRPGSATPTSRSSRRRTRSATPRRARKAMENMISAHPDLDAVFSTSDGQSIGAVQGAQGGRQGPAVRLVRRAGARREGDPERQGDRRLGRRGRRSRSAPTRCARRSRAAREEPGREAHARAGHRGRQGQRGRAGRDRRCPSPITSPARRPAGDRGRGFGAAHADAVAAPSRSTAGCSGETAGDLRRRMASGRGGAGAPAGPELVEEIEGIAAGAGQDPSDCSRSTPAPSCSPPPTRRRVLGDRARLRRGVVLAQTWDWHPDLAAARVCGPSSSRSGRGSPPSPRPGSSPRSGSTATALACTLNFLSCSADGGRRRRPDPRAAARAPARCATAAEALELLLAAPVSASSCVTVAARPPARALSPSSSARAVPPSRPDDDGVLVHTNHFLAPSAAGEDPEPAMHPSTLLRRWHLGRVLAGHGGGTRRWRSTCRPASRCAGTTTRRRLGATGARRSCPSCWTQARPRCGSPPGRRAAPPTARGAPVSRRSPSASTSTARPASRTAAADSSSG